MYDETRRQTHRRRGARPKGCAAKTASTLPPWCSTDPRPTTCPSSAAGTGHGFEDAPVVTPVEMHGVEELGAPQDGLPRAAHLDVMEIALDLVERSTRPDPTSTTLRSTTNKTFEMLRRADTIGVFQLEAGRAAR